VKNVTLALRGLAARVSAISFCNPATKSVYDSSVTTVSSLMSWTVTGYPSAPVLIDGQPQPSTDLLASRDRVIALLEHAHYEHVGVIPALVEQNGRR
jgi:hypothetical protein